MDVYSWDNESAGFLLIQWREKIFWDGSSVRYPYVINGEYQMEYDTENENVVFLTCCNDVFRANYVCKAPSGKDYNEILSKVPEMLFTSKELVQ